MNYERNNLSQEAEAIIAKRCILFNMTDCICAKDFAISLSLSLFPYIFLSIYKFLYRTNVFLYVYAFIYHYHATINKQLRRTVADTGLGIYKT